MEGSRDKGPVNRGGYRATILYCGGSYSMILNISVRPERSEAKSKDALIPLPNRSEPLQVHLVAEAEFGEGLLQLRLQVPGEP